jgi:hypothetical protein
LTTDEKTSNQPANFWIEGIQPGEAYIRLDITSNGALIHSESVRIEVNSDRTPTQSNERSRLLARNRAHAIKQMPNIRAVAAVISATEPLLTWTEKPLRADVTASLWAGFQTTDGNSWVQAGVEAEVKKGDKYLFGKNFDESKSYVYGEACYNYALFQQSGGDTRYFNRQTYPSATIQAGIHKWQKLQVQSEYVVANDPGNIYGDKIEIKIAPEDNNFNFLPAPLVILNAQPASNNKPAVDLSTITYNVIEAGSENSASVTRLPGTPVSRGNIYYISIKDGPRNNVSPTYRTVNLTQEDTEIVYVNPSINPSGTISYKTYNNAGVLNYQHYNLRLLNPYSFEIWDSYNWKEKDARKW